jgi:hypothetical protein
MCMRCYGKARRRGEIQIRPTRTRTVSERFWPLVNKNGPVIRHNLGRCWIWTGQPNVWGYGVFAVGRRSRTGAHRVAWGLTNGPIPVGLLALHKCDNRLCVRPDHLFLGDQADNAQDMREKRRQAQGSRVGGAKLTEAAVREIRLRAHSPGDFDLLAEEFGVHPDTVKLVVARKTWKHV